ncbi:RAD55 family ATPase [Azospirillum agricola]|uniref:RAD55 family ATPase n=1 Tax=Azospirillum agricola TaxID=1720247 RepID=UPI000A0EF80B|nr:ATPase domain-containing protein [Azospirillum agricola]SMH46296.1 circadian clock protein KaiC [Azospirillum lipoferum]
MRKLDRLPTGIASLDLILDGGLLRGGAYILQGFPGAGKTVLANQIASHRIREDGRVVYITLLSEGHDRMMAHLGQMTFFDPEIVAGRLTYVSGYPELEKNGLSGLSRLVRTEAERHKAELVVLDGLFAAEEAAGSSHAFRRLVHELQAHAHVTGLTLLLLTNAKREPGSPEYTMVDGWLEMTDVRAEGRVVRELEVHKFRGGNAVRGRHHYRISEHGVEVYPRLEGLAGRKPEPSSAPTFVSTGITKLDRMLKGGLAIGSASLLTGPSGTGKTVAALQFAGAATSEAPCLFLGFYESPDRLRHKARGIGVDVAALEASGVLHLHWCSPTEILVDEVAAWLLDELERSGARRLVVDGIAGFQQNLVESGRMGRFLTALGNELRALGVTTLYTSAMTGDGYYPAPAPLGVAELSPLIDNLLTMRLVERNENIHKMLSIVKVPDRDFDTRLTTYTIGPTGIVLAG